MCCWAREGVGGEKAGTSQQDCIMLDRRRICNGIINGIWIKRNETFYGINAGVYNVEWHLILFPPLHLIFFPATRRVALRNH